MEDKTMNYNTASLSVSDLIFATLIVGGKVIASVCRNNFASINDIVKFIATSAGRFMGLAQLNIRNKTQGWSMNMALASKLQTNFNRPTASQYKQASLFA